MHRRRRAPRTRMRQASARARTLWLSWPLLRRFAGTGAGDESLSHFSVGLGIIALVALVLLVMGHWLGIGKGGMERKIAYPIFLWALGFGGALIGAK